jgi:type I restriction enzyme R subunit
MKTTADVPGSHPAPSLPPPSGSRRIALRAASFWPRLRGEINRRGTIDVLRGGVKHGPHHVELFHGTPSAGNETARRLFELNRFTVTRQLRYSRDETQHSLDIALFINGLPVFTFELKNNLTKQTVHDAIRQYERDRNPKEPLFRLGRCVAHFAADENEVRFRTHLKGRASWFLPFNRGWNQGAGNPPNPEGLKTEYLWREVLDRGSLTDILENYAQLLEEMDTETGRKKRKLIWPRYQQLDVVRRLLAAAGQSRGREALLDPALGGQPQEFFNRVAGAPDDPPEEGRQARLRLDHRGHRPPDPGQADP